MPLLINGEVSQDNWLTLGSEDDFVLASQTQPVIYPLASYLEHAQALVDLADVSGVLVNGDDDLATLLALLDKVAVVAIDFPVLRDGRGFSIARQVVRAGFAGQVRAVGDVAFDRLDYMHRSGFNAYQVPQERFSEDIARAFSEVSV
ncbi:MAG: DUF934 domain-containing protein, partial [Pseudomonadales bacterium]